MLLTPSAETPPADTERAVAALFHKARQAAPCIVFLDEVDGLAGARGTGDDGARVGDRVLSQLLVRHLCHSSTCSDSPHLPRSTPRPACPHLSIIPRPWS